MTAAWSRPEWQAEIERKASLDRFLERDGDDVSFKRLAGGDDTLEGQIKRGCEENLTLTP